MLDFLNGERKADDARRAKAIRTRPAPRRVSNKKDIKPDRNIGVDLDDFDIHWGDGPDGVNPDEDGLASAGGGTSRHFTVWFHVYVAAQAARWVRQGGPHDGFVGVAWRCGAFRRVQGP